MKYVSFLNYGCILLCKNMLESAKRVNIDIFENFFIYCLDMKSYEELSSLVKNTILYIPTEKTDQIEEYQTWSFNKNSGFRKIVKHKWTIIKEVYEKYIHDTPDEFLCWVDTDIVFLRNFEAKDLFKMENSNIHILFQTDVPGSRICSGFMIFDNSDISSDLISECCKDNTDDDQLIINNLYCKTGISKNIKILDRFLFPNGNIYYTLKNRNPDAFIVHNNWIVGSTEKINRFKNDGKWYISD